MVNKKIITGIIAMLILFSTLNLAVAEEGSNICAVYVTGIGCPNCAKTDHVLLSDYTSENPDLIVIEYEIYQLRDSNYETAQSYFDNYLTDVIAGVPLILFNKDNAQLGRFQVLDSENTIKSLDSNPCPLPDGSMKEFSELDLTELDGKVKIWTKNRVLISGEGGDNNLLKKLINADDVPSALQNAEYEIIKPEPATISGGNIEFTDAAKIGNWRVQWNSAVNNTPTQPEENNESSSWYMWIIIIVVVIIILALILFRKK